MNDPASTQTTEREQEAEAPHTEEGKPADLAYWRERAIQAEQEAEAP